MKRMIWVLVFILWVHSVQAHGDAHIRIQEINAQLADDPNNPQHYFDRGILYQSHNDFNAAFLDYQKVIDLNPEFGTVILKLSELCLSNDLGKMALAYAEEYLQYKPEEAKAWVTRGKAQSYLENYEMAKADYQKAVELESPHPEYFYDLSEIILQNNEQDHELAIEYMRKAQSEIGDLTGFRERIIELELDRGNIENALVELDLLIEKSPRTENWQAMKGDILLKAGRTEEAIEAYIQAKMAIDRLSPNKKKTDFIRELNARVEEALATTN